MSANRRLVRVISPCHLGSQEKHSDEQERHRCKGDHCQTRVMPNHDDDDSADGDNVCQ